MKRFIIRGRFYFMLITSLAFLGTSFLHGEYLPGGNLDVSDMASQEQVIPQEPPVDLIGKVAENDRVLILSAREQYQTFLGEVSLVTGLTKACAYISTKLHEISQQDAKLQLIINDIEKLQQILDDGRFLAILNNGQDASVKKDLEPLLDTLTKNTQVAVDFAVALKDEQFAQAWDLLTEILSAVKKDDKKALAACYAEHLKPYSKKAHAILTDVIAELEKKIEFNEAYGDKVLRHAYVSLANELKKYLKTLTIFVSLQEKSTSGQSLSHTLFPLIAHSFNFYKTFLDFYKKDYDYNKFYTFMLDSGLSTALSVWSFYLKVSGSMDDSGAHHLMDIIKGNSSTSSLNPIQEMNDLRNAAGMALLSKFFPFFSSNSMEKPVHGAVRGVGKILASWVYYHAFHCLLFSDESPGIIEMPNGDQTRVLNGETYLPLAPTTQFLVSPEGTFLKENGNGMNGSVWPSDYKHLRKTAFGALNEGQRYAFKQLHEYLRINFHPQAMETIEQSTLGIVKPELLGYMAETFLPLIMLTPNDVLKCQPEDVFGDWYKNNKDYIEANQLNTKAYYVECRLMSYVFSSLGSFGGSFLAQKYQSAFGKAITYGAEKALSLCVSAGLVSSETVELFSDVKSEFNEYFKEKMGVDFEVFLDKTLKNIFIPGSSERTFIVSNLKKLGVLKDSDSADSVAETKQILAFVLKHLAHHGLIAYLDVEEIKQQFEQDSTKGDEIVKQIGATIYTHIIAKIGGMVGSYAGLGVKNLVQWGCGPIYPKIQNAFTA